MRHSRKPAISFAAVLVSAFAIPVLSAEQKEWPTCASAKKEAAWAKSQRDSVSDDVLLQWAIKKLGAPTTCEARITDQTEEGTFGLISFRFKDESTFLVETMPPESTIVTLLMAKGLADEKEALHQLKMATGKAGLHIDWDKPPEITHDKRTVSKSFWDPAEGINGQGTLIYEDSTLVSLRWSMAL